MARIYLDAWGIKRGPHGIARYCRSLVPALVAAAPQHSFVILRPRGEAGRLVCAGAAPEVEIPLPRTDWATLAFRPLLEAVFRRHGPPDLYHSLFHMLPLGVRRGMSRPRSIVVTLHDLIAIDLVDQVKTGALARAWARRFDRLVIPLALRTADHVICVSEATRQRATEWVPLDRSTAVHSGVDPLLPYAAEGAPLPHGAGRFRSYIAALGVARPYKNVACIVRALPAIRRVRPDVGLVLIGGDGAAADEIQRLELSDAVVITPPVDDRDLAALVGAADAFVIASRAEGFGLPLLEAMAIGTPVAASDIPALREVGGDAASWFDPDSPEQLAAVTLRLLDDAALRSRMVACGRARASEMTWQKTAAATLAVYERVLSGVGAAPALRAARTGFGRGAI